MVWPHGQKVIVCILACMHTHTHTLSLSPSLFFVINTQMEAHHSRSAWLSLQYHGSHHYNTNYIEFSNEWSRWFSNLFVKSPPKSTPTHRWTRRGDATVARHGPMHRHLPQHRAVGAVVGVGRHRPDPEPRRIPADLWGAPGLKGAPWRLESSEVKSKT